MSTESEPIDGGVATRARRIPLAVHAGLLLVVLSVLVPVAGTQASFSSDEGAYVFQARSVADGTWEVEHPYPEADPGDVGFPLALAQRTPEGWVAMGEDPARVALLATADRVGGVTAMVGLAVLGTWTASLAAALIAARRNPRHRLWALWIVGLGTPLFFDSYLVLGHSEGAAACGFAAWFALRLRAGVRSVDVVGLAGAIVLGICMRSEAVLFVGALTVVLLVDGIRQHRRPSLLAGAVVATTGLMTAGALALWERAIVPGDSVQKVLDAAAPRTVGGRWSAFVTTWLRPGYAPSDTWQSMLTVALVVGVVAVILARTGRDAGLVIGLCGLVLACAAFLAVDAIGPYTDQVVPGLLMACPFLGVGMFTLRRVEGETAILGAVVAVFAAAVLATQYDRGGTLEWGWRYFALAIPLVVPVFLATWQALAEAVGTRAVRISGVAALVGLTLALDVAGLAAIRNNHAFVDRILAAADQAGATTKPPPDGGAPVFLTTNANIGRFTWPASERQRWLWVEPGDVPSLLEGLRAEGVTEVVVATQNPRDDTALLDAGRDREAARRAGSWRFFVVEI